MMNLIYVDPRGDDGRGFPRLLPRDGQERERAGGADAPLARRGGPFGRGPQGHPLSARTLLQGDTHLRRGKSCV